MKRHALLLILGLAGCGDASTTSRDLTTHCVEHTIGSGAAGTTTTSDCEISIDTKSKSMGW